MELLMIMHELLHMR